MVDVLDNCDDPVIHNGNNEAPMADSDNVGDNRFIINILSSFTSPSFDYRTFSHDSNLCIPWLYNNAEDEVLQV